MVSDVVEVKKVPSPQPIHPAPGQQLVLEGVPWRTYTQLLRLFDDRHLRLTYDQGTLEIMSPLPIHELYKKLIDRLVSTLVEELDWNMASYGSTTFKSRKRERGLEPDECYWIQNESTVRGQDILDLSKVPPPDLAIEIDITNSSLDR